MKDKEVRQDVIKLDALVRGLKTIIERPVRVEAFFDLTQVQDLNTNLNSIRAHSLEWENQISNICSQLNRLHDRIAAIEASSLQLEMRMDLADKRLKALETVKEVLPKRRKK